MFTPHTPRSVPGRLGPIMGQWAGLPGLDQTQSNIPSINLHISKSRWERERAFQLKKEPDLIQQELCLTASQGVGVWMVCSPGSPVFAWPHGHDIFPSGWLMSQSTFPSPAPPHTMSLHTTPATLGSQLEHNNIYKFEDKYFLHFSSK